MKKRREIRAGTVVILVIGFLLIFGGLFGLWRILGTEATAESASAISGKELKKDQEYYFEDLIIVDCYAEAEETVGFITTKTMYYAAMFLDGEDKAYVISLESTEGDADYDELKNYAQDYSAYIGDVNLPGYYTTSNNLSLDGELQSYYREVVEAYGLEELGADALSMLNLKYVCETEGEYTALARKEHLLLAVLLVLQAVGGAVLILRHLIRERYARAALARYQESAGKAISEAAGRESAPPDAE